eukprot:1573524-Pyramimonas_sp.AAC.1
MSAAHCRIGGRLRRPSLQDWETRARCISLRKCWWRRLAPGAPLRVRCLQSAGHVQPSLGLSQ